MHENEVDSGRARVSPLVAAVVAGGLAVGGRALYRRLQPEKQHDRGDNFYDCIANLDTLIRQEVGEDVDYVMIGGGASEPLKDSRTRLEDPDIIPPDDLFKPQFREDTGAKCDVDLIILTRDPQVIKRIKRALRPNKKILAEGTEEQKQAELAKPGAKLKLGITGMVSGEDYYKPSEGTKAKAMKGFMKDWTSHRLEFEDGRRIFTISDVIVNLPDEYFEPHYLVLKNGERVPVLHPLIQVLCYASRTCHGIRIRDVSKVTEIMDNIGERYGAHLVWGKNNETVSLVFDQPTTNPGVLAALKFADDKNALRWLYTKNRLGMRQACLLAGKQAVHRFVDIHFVEFGQGGPLYDKVLSKFSDEDQEEDD